MKIQAVIFDWAGTTVDFGSCGPVSAIQAAFGEFGIVLSESDARKPMGLLKRDHVVAVLAFPHVAASWEEQHAAAPTDQDVERVYQRFVALQASALLDHAELLPEVLPAVEQLRSRGIRIGSTTGYTRAMLDPVARAAAGQGYQPDVSLTPDEVGGAGRPAPFMILENLVRLRVWPPTSVVKVGDTPVDMQEGRNAGVWTVGVAATGNGVGCGWNEFQQMTSSEQGNRIDAARKSLYEGGAHFVIDTLNGLAEVIQEIESTTSGTEISLIANAGIVESALHR